MTIALGIDNPNSKYNQDDRAAQSPLASVPALPLPVKSQIHILEITIRAIAQMRDAYFAAGDIPRALEQETRIDGIRLEVRELKEGMQL